MKQPFGKGWENPTLVCNLKSNEQPVQKHPSTKNTTPVGFDNFCKKMEKHFAESNLSTEEAEEIYKLLEQSKQISDQQFGMPSPDLPPNKSLNVEQLKKRAALKKISDSVIEVFYFYMGCGTNYIHNRIILIDKKIEKVESIESWSGKSPC